MLKLRMESSGWTDRGEDYGRELETFIFRRIISVRESENRAEKADEHIISCHSENKTKLLYLINRAPQYISASLITFVSSLLEGKPDSRSIKNKLWEDARRRERVPCVFRPDSSVFQPSRI